MTTPRRLLLAGLSALILGASFFIYTSWSKKPERFTATLTEIKGVQAIYTFRHPKLIAEDLDLLMTEVPEAAMGRMLLGAGLAAYGYPEFEDVAAGSNVGIALLELTSTDFQTTRPAVVGFIKLKDGGPLSKLLTQPGIATQRHGDWLWVAQDPSDFARVKTADAIIAHLSQPQTEEIRVWGRSSPPLLARLKQALMPMLDEKFADRPNTDRRATAAYVEVLWSYLEQLHSAGGSLDINAKGITLTTYAQFEPDTDLGTLLRYKPKAAPQQIAASIPNDGLIAAVIHQNIPGQVEFVSTLLDKLIAVDYPRGAKLLAAAKTSYLSLSAHNDGGMVVTMNMTPSKNPEANPVQDTFGVITGKFTPAEVTASYKATAAMTEELTNSLLLVVGSFSPGAIVPEIKTEFKENAFAIDDIKFDSLTTKSNVNEAISTTSQFYGVVNGNIVYASSEATLRAKVPALLAKEKVPNGITLAPKPDEFAVVDLNGAALVDAAIKAADIRTSNPKLLAQIKAIRDGFAAAPPVQAVVGASQAKAGATITIPYKFISQGIQLYQFTSANSFDPEERIRAIP